MLSSFAERGFSAVREDPIFPGTKLSYPFLPDLLSAWLVRCGFSVQTSLIVPAFVAILGSVIALYFFARRIAGPIGAMAAPFLLFFNGSIVGCYYLWRDSRISHSLGSTILPLNVDYSHLPERNIHFSNLVSEYILPQRAAEFGLFLGLLAVQFLWLFWDTRKTKYLVYASLMLSCMPYVHFHSFVALLMVAGFLFCIQFLADPGYWSVIRDWLFFQSADYSGTAAGALDFACACRTLPAGAMGLDERQRSTVVVLAEKLEPALAGVRPRLLDGNA